VENERVSKHKHGGGGQHVKACLRGITHVGEGGVGLGLAWSLAAWSRVVPSLWGRLHV
jgi:hypothetical protein